MPELKASPRNRALGLLADALSGAKSAADTVQLPVVGGLGSLLFGDAPELVNDVAYYGPQALVRGGNAATGGLGTFAPDRRVLDAIGVAPMAPGAVRAAKTALNPMTYGRAFVEAQAPAVMSPITAWHGSPHKFRKFDNSKMGTGEGAQAYGAGAYLADARPVAERYRINLSVNPQTIVGGVPIADLYSQIREQLSTLSPARAKIGNEKLQVLEDLMTSQQPEISSLSKTTKTWFNGTVKPAIESQGYLYKADIPDEVVANMLLWDKPLSEQPEVVRKALTTPDDNGYSLISNLQADPSFKSFTGGDIYNALTRMSSSQMGVSKRLNEAGIPGIRYLDAGSRGQGAGTMNTVVFDDSIIKILERNGVPWGLLTD